MDWDNMNDSINSFIAYSFINDKILNKDNDLIIATSDSDDEDDEE